MMNPPLFCTHRERHGSSTAPPFARSLPLTPPLIPNPPSGALHAPDADANHGSQVRPTKRHRTDSETSNPLLPVEPTLRLSSLLVLTGPRYGENGISPECPRGSSSALCTPTTLRSAASCTQIYLTRTDHGSWVLVSASQAHELALSCHADYHRFDVREWTRTESRVSAGPSTAAARNHGDGGPATCTTHGKLAQVRVSRGRPSWLSHTAAAPPSWTRPIATRATRARNGGR